MAAPVVKASVDPSNTPNFSLLMGEQARQLFASLTPMQLELLQSALRSAQGISPVDTASAQPTAAMSWQPAVVVEPKPTAVVSPPSTAAMSPPSTAVMNPQSTAAMNPQSPPRTFSTLLHSFPASGVGESQQKKRKRAVGKPVIASAIPLIRGEKPTRPLNSWMAFRSKLCLQISG
jgi:hypothetical protein